MVTTSPGTYRSHRLQFKQLWLDGLSSEIQTTEHSAPMHQCDNLNLVPTCGTKTIVHTEQ